MGRQPWIVFGLLKTENGVSPASVVSSSELMFSLALFIAVYAALAVTDLFLLKKYGAAGIETGA
jgi:cytochrome d ubiquinol oxidase subunit I